MTNKPMTVPTLGLLSITDGRLMRDIGEVYKTFEPMAGRQVWTHELPGLARRLMATGLVETLPAAFQPQNTEHLSFAEARDSALAAHGETITLPEAFRGCLDMTKRNPVETLDDAIVAARQGVPDADA